MKDVEVVLLWVPLTDGCTAHLVDTTPFSSLKPPHLSYLPKCQHWLHGNLHKNASFSTITNKSSFTRTEKCHYIVYRLFVVLLWTYSYEFHNITWWHCDWITSLNIVYSSQHISYYFDTPFSLQRISIIWCRIIPIVSPKYIELFTVLHLIEFIFFYLFECSRQMRSSSLERNSSANGVLGSGEEHAPIGVVTPSAAMSRLQASRTAWRSHDNEISYTSLNYEEDDDDQPVNYSLKYSDELGAAATVSGVTTPRSRPGEQSSQQAGIQTSGENVNMESKCTAKKVLSIWMINYIMISSSLIP